MKKYSNYYYLAHKVGVLGAGVLGDSLGSLWEGGD